MAKLPRPRYQRAFVRWLDENASRFAVSVLITCKHRDYIGFTFDGINPCLKGVLRKEGIEIYYEDESFYDKLMSFWTIPERAQEACICYVSSMCHEQNHEIYSRREALWEDRLFEPFLAWANKELIASRWVVLYGGNLSEGYGAAMLMNDVPIGEGPGLLASGIWLPVWKNSLGRPH